MNPYINEDGELNINDALKYIIRHWLLVILLGLVCAVALAGFKGLIPTGGSSRGKTVEVPESGETDLKTAQEKYEEDLALYLDQKGSLTSSLKDMKQDFSRLNVYLQESAYMKIDPYAIAESKATYSIACAESESAGAAAVAAKAITQDIQSGEYLGEVARQLGMDEKYILQLIYVRNSAEEAIEKSDDNRITLTVTAIGIDKEQTSAILSSVTGEIEKMCMNPGEYNGLESVTVTHLSDSFRIYIDRGLMNAQASYRTDATNLIGSIAAVQSQLDGLDMPQESDYSDDTEVVASARPSKKAILKYGVVGFAIGAFLMCVILLFMYIGNDTLQSYQVLQMRFKIRFLGEFKSRNTEDKLKESDVIDLIAANIRNHDAELANHKLLVTGICDEMLLTGIANGLRKKLTAGEVKVVSDIAQSAEGRTELAACDEIVLIEQKGKSKYSRISAELMAAADLEKAVIGVVVA